MRDYPSTSWLSTFFIHAGYPPSKISYHEVRFSVVYIASVTYARKSQRICYLYGCLRDLSRLVISTALGILKKRRYISVKLPVDVAKPTKSRINRETQSLNSSVFEPGLLINVENLATEIFMNVKKGRWKRTRVYEKLCLKLIKFLRLIKKENVEEKIFSCNFS